LVDRAGRAQNEPEANHRARKQEVRWWRRPSHRGSPGPPQEIENREDDRSERSACKDSPNPPASVAADARVETHQSRHCDVPMAKNLEV
jgi:hypothetical protein